MGEEEKSTAKNLEGMSTKDSIRKQIDAFYNRRRQKNNTEEGEKEEGEEDKSAEGKPKEVDEKPEKEEDKSDEAKRDGEEEKSTAKNLEGVSTKDSLRKKIDAFYR